jgi:hypothetical protein
MEGKRTNPFMKDAGKKAAATREAKTSGAKLPARLWPRDWPAKRAQRLMVATLCTMTPKHSPGPPMDLANMREQGVL